MSLTGPTTVPPGSTNEYQLQIGVTGSQNKGGLNVAASDGTLSTGGNAATNTQERNNNTTGLPEITHAGAKAASGGFITFSFLWTAPSDFTSVTLTAWGNAVNGVGTSAGDKADVDSLVITPGAAPPPGVECAAAPLAGCRKPTKSGAAVFQLKDNANDSKDALTWKWNKGDATVLSDFGDPVNGPTTYLLCVYDSLPSLALSATVDPSGTCGTKPCWKATKTGFTYTNPITNADGVMQVQLVSGVAGKAKIQVKGKGTNLALPILPLVQNPTVTVQLVNSDGVCWEASYSSPAKKNDSSQFNDKSD